MPDSVPSSERAAAPDVGRLAGSLGLRSDHPAVRRLAELADGEVAAFGHFDTLIQAANRAHGWKAVEDAFRRLGGRFTGKNQFKRKRPLDGARLRQLCESLGPRAGGQDRAAGDS